MCGIFGYFDRAGQHMATVQLAAMGKRIRHRGPDDSGIFESASAAVGNQRLSIIDVERGHQPFVSDDGRIAVVQNGEIFNYLELADVVARRGNPCRTKSDTEVLLRLYELEGMEFLSRLNGMFAIAILDLSRNAMFLARDRIGVKPLFVCEKGARLLFASEIKALLAAGIEAQLDPQALHLFLTYNFVPPPTTLFAGVRHVRPGVYLELTREGVKEVTWWSVVDGTDTETRPEDEWAEEVLTTLHDAVRLRLRSDVPFGAFLSGGVDSSTVVGLMARETSGVRTFSIGFEEPDFDESVYAEQAARRFDTIHVCETVSTNMLELWPYVTYHCDQAHGDVSFMPTYRLAELASRHVKVVLTGDGGDELFAGYDKYRSFFASLPPNVGDEEFIDAYARHTGLFAPEEIEGLLEPRFLRQLEGHDPLDPMRELIRVGRGLDRINQALLFDTSLLLPGNNLVKPDRMGMAVSLEARTPFLDYRLVELAFRMPGRLKLHGGETKYILKRAVEPLIGPELTHRRKQMFTVPIGDWLRESPEKMRELLVSGPATERGYFRRDRIVEMIDRHVSGEANYTRQLRALIALELWLQLFIDNKHPNKSW